MLLQERGRQTALLVRAHKMVHKIHVISFPSVNRMTTDLTTESQNHRIITVKYISIFILDVKTKEKYQLEMTNYTYSVTV